MTTSPSQLPDPAHRDETDEQRSRRLALRTRHAHALAALMQERRDLRGVLPLADLVEESLRWSA